MHEKQTMRASLLQAIEAYCRENRLSDSLFGTKAARDPHFVFRLRDGKGTLGKLEEVESFLMRALASK